MTDEDGWAAPWVAEKIRKCEEVVSVAANGNRLAIKRKATCQITVATLAAKVVSAEAIHNAIGDDQDVDFVVNVPKDSYFTGDALEFARDRQIALGGVGDLMRALGMPDVRQYVQPTIEFIERSLRQHNRVAKFERCADLYYLIRRKRRLRNLFVVFLHEYELVADHIRAARDRYGQFDIVVITNPNGKTTSSAESVAESFGCRIYMWRDFMAALAQQ